MDSSKVHYAELPSRNMLIDVIVNSLPGYYPARSEFNIEYDNNAEQVLTDVCSLYDDIINNNGQPEYESEEENDEDELDDIKLENLDEYGKPLIEIKSETDDTIEKIPKNISENKKNVHNTRRKVNKSSFEEETIKSNTKSDVETIDERNKRTLKRRRENFNESEQEENVETVKKKKITKKSDKSEISNKESDVKPVLINNDVIDTVSKDIEHSRVKSSSGRISMEDKDVLEELCLTTIDIYNNKLRERNFRKKFVRDHGFLDQNRICSYYNIHNIELSTFDSLFKKFIKLFDNAYEFDMFIQSLKLENDLKTKLNQFEELRSNGIKYKKLIPLYNKLKNNRNELYENVKSLTLNDIVNNPSINIPLAEIKAKKQISRKLDITHLPSFRLLNEQEKQLCETIRLTPESYLNFKDLMVKECKKQGSLKLAQARTFLKIDVNKTRKIYDFLINNNFIWKE